MVPQREPTPNLDGFQLPASAAIRQEWEEAFSALRRVDLTWSQISEGYRASLASGQGRPDIPTLRAWCDYGGLHPADVAAEAILVRMSAVLQIHAVYPGLDLAAHAGIALRDLRVERDVIQFLGSAPYAGSA